MQTICLINPPSTFLIDDKVFLSLGLLYIASALENNGYKIDFIDLSGENNELNLLKKYLQSSSTTVFGITATTPQIPDVYKVIEFIRSNKPFAKIILGGAHVSLVHAASKRELKMSQPGRATQSLAKLYEKFDVLVTGNGDKAILDAVLPDSPKIIDGDDPKSKYFIHQSDFDNLPRPALHLINFASYKYTIEGVPATSIIAQLGCPFKCKFCGGRHASYLRRLRKRSVKNIISEIKDTYIKYGTRAFMFYDDELNINSSFTTLLKSLCDLQSSLGIEMHFRGFIKSELFDREQAKWMQKAGFKWVLSGFESASPKMLKNMGKTATVEDNIRCLETAKLNGLRVKALMSIGHPGESPETIEETYEWLNKYEPDDFDITIISTYPGSTYYDDAVIHDKEKNIWVYTVKDSKDKLYCEDIDYSNTPQFYKGKPNGGYSAYVYTDYISSKDLVKLRDKMEITLRKNIITLPNHCPHEVQHEHSMGQISYA